MNTHDKLGEALRRKKELTKELEEVNAQLNEAIRLSLEEAIAELKMFEEQAVLMYTKQAIREEIRQFEKQLNYIKNGK